MKLKRSKISPEQMVTLPPLKILLIQSTSNIGALLVLSLYLLVDSFFIGNYLKQNGLAAQAIIQTFEYIINQMVSMSLSIGTTAYIGPELALKNYSKVNSYASQFFLTTLIYSAIVPIIAGPLLPQIIKFLGATEGVVTKYGIQYLQIMMTVGPFAYAMNVSFLPLLRSQNKTQLAMVIQTVSATLNIVFDSLFFPLLNDKLEMYSASLSTCIALLATGIYTTMYLFSTKSSSVIRFQLKQMKITWNFFKIIVVQALPQFLNSLPFCICSILQMNQIRKYAGDDATQLSAILGISSRYGVFVNLPRQGVYMALITLISYNLGSQRPDRIKMFIYHSLWFSYLIGILIIIVMVALMKYLILIYDRDENFVSVATPLVRWSYSGLWSGFPIQAISGLKQMEKKPWIASLWQLCRFIVNIIIVMVTPLIADIKWIVLATSLTEVICFVPSQIAILLEAKKYQKMWDKLQETKQNVTKEEIESPEIQIQV